MVSVDVKHHAERRQKRNSGLGLRNASHPTHKKVERERERERERGGGEEREREREREREKHASLD